MYDTLFKLIKYNYMIGCYAVKQNVLYELTL